MRRSMLPISGVARTRRNWMVASAEKLKAYRIMERREYFPY